MMKTFFLAILIALFTSHNHVLGGINAGDYAGHTPLMMAAIGGHTELVVQLIRANARMEETTPDGHTALMLASSRGRVDSVKELCAAGANVDARTRFGNHNSLMMAAYENHADVIDVLWNYGARLDTRDAFGNTALMLGANRGNQEAIEALFHYDPGLVVYRNHAGMTAAEIARQSRNYYLALYLERNGIMTTTTRLCDGCSGFIMRANRLCVACIQLIKDIMREYRLMLRR